MIERRKLFASLLAAPVAGVKPTSENQKVLRREDAVLINTGPWVVKQAGLVVTIANGDIGCAHPPTVRIG